MVVALTCTIGRFALPGMTCLSEALLLADGGAVAVWSPSGLSYNKGAEQLAELFYRAAFREDIPVLGTAINTALAQYQDPSLDYMRGIYNLLGDPALRLTGVAFLGSRLSLTAWSREQFSDKEFADSSADITSDPDGDGVPNLLEYAGGTNPHVPDSSSTMRIIGPWAVTPHPSGEVLVSYQQRHGVTDAVCHLQVSHDLSTWSNADHYITKTEIVDDGNGTTETVIVSLSVPPSDGGRVLFVRLVVSPL